MSIMDILGKRMVFFDGGTGTLLQEKGLLPGELPELWTIERKEDLIRIHENYFRAGSDMVLTNTFGANRLKLHGCPYTVEQLIKGAVHNAAEARERSGKDGFVALDMGPTGKLLKPMGDLDFEDAYEAFKEMAIYGEKAGADLILIETMSDMYELKAAVLAAKENTSLPVFATVVFDERGKMLTGGNVPAVVAMLEGLHIDALGVNCGLGPYQMAETVDNLLKYASVPVIVKPNAGMPKTVNGKTIFDINPEDFASAMKAIGEKGAWILGGCCGTTPEHLSAVWKLCKDICPKPITFKEDTITSSYSQAVFIDGDPVIIGERINPTGKKRFKQALRDGDMEYILKEGLAQQDNGAHVLDVNVGLPEIHEPSMLVQVIHEIQSIIDLPLQIDTTNAAAMEQALRTYNGKAMVNSVNGKQEIMDEIFPLVQKYGGVVVALTLDEDGIPDTAQGRLEIAKKIVKEAEKYQIAKKDIVVDVLCMAVSSDSTSAKVTLEAIKLVKEELGVHTVLGLSNISFGLPSRERINISFYTMALQNGLDSAIINPNNAAMRQAYFAYRALAGFDENCLDYINFCGESPDTASGLPQNTGTMTLKEAIEKGLTELSGTLTGEMLKEKESMEIIDDHLIPALDTVGKGFEKGSLFLPQLLMSADAAKQAFEVIRVHMSSQGTAPEKIGKIILATVKGDIHDIGKNIVKVLLENYNFQVIDLGKDVPPEKIVETAIAENVPLIGLSALMTTTVPSMEATIKALHSAGHPCKVMVGGAVLTQEYADMIGADFYGKDAMTSVHYAQKVFSEL